MQLYNIKSLENKNRKILIDKFNKLYVLDKNGIHSLLNQHNISSEFFDLTKLNINFSDFYDIRETNLKLFNKINKKTAFKIIIDILKYLTNNYTKKQFDKIINNKSNFNELIFNITQLLKLNLINKKDSDNKLNLYADNNIFDKNLNVFIYNINQLKDIFNTYISKDIIQVKKIIENLICLHTKKQIDTLLQNFICDCQLIENIQLLSMLKSQIDDQLHLKISKDDVIQEIEKFKNYYTKLQFDNLLQKKVSFNIFKNFLYLNCYSKEIIKNLLLPKLTFEQVINAIYYITYQKEEINKMFSFIESKEDLKIIKNYLINLANTYSKEEFNIQLDKKLSKQQFIALLSNYTLPKLQIDTIINNTKSYKVDLSFSCYDMLNGNQLKIDNIYKDDILIPSSNYNYSENNSYNKTRYLYNISFNDITQDYILKIKKDNYSDAIITCPVTDYSRINNNTIDLGRIPLLQQTRKNGYTLVWGQTPRDLDSHMFSFNQNFEQQEHCYFSTKYHDTSKITLDTDETESYGPQTITLQNANLNWYYLYTIHNYSHQSFNFNYNNNTFIHLVHLGKVYSYQPQNLEANDCYWFDVFIRHNNKIYIINKNINTSLRNSSCDTSISSETAKSIIEEYINNATEIIDLE